MSYLLHVARLQSQVLRRKGTVPLMLEYQVPEETSPYLVTSSSSVMWVSEPHPGGVVKAAVRESSLGNFFCEILESVTSMGVEMGWDNVHPMTLDGIQAAIAHLMFYDLEPLELLIPRAHPVGSHGTTKGDDDDDSQGVDGEEEVPASLMPTDLRPFIEEAGLPFRPCAWMPEGTMVVVPKDRTYVGVVHHVIGKKIAGVVHNAARGIAVVRRNIELVDRTLPEPDPA